MMSEVESCATSSLKGGGRAKDGGEEEDCGPPEDYTRKLPHELWIKIASNLSSYELCSLSLVSWRFHDVAMDPILWTSVSLLGDAVAGTKTIEKLIQRCCLLTDLSIQRRDDVSILLSTVANSCKKLRCLEVLKCPILTYQDLENLSQHCPVLVHLDLSFTGCLNRDRDHHEMEGSNLCTCLSSNSFTSLLRNFKSLAHLYLFACKNLNSSGLREIADSCPNLESLNVDEVNYLDDDSFIYLISKCKDKLKSLSVDGETLTDLSFSRFGELKKLEILSVSFAENMGRKGLQSIANLSGLCWLKIRKGTALISSDFVQAFSNGNLKELLFLDLSECSKLTDLGLMTLAKNCPNLGTLNLCWCWELTDSSLKFVVTYCRCLINLNLLGLVRLSGEFLLCDIPRLLKGLKTLDLQQCANVELSHLQDLLELMPGLNIKDYYGERVYPIQCLQNILLSDDAEDTIFLTV